MGILKNREEFLPVTCAILKEEDRNAFFNKIKKLPGGKPDEIARLLNVPPGTVADWMNGKGNVPYHFLQRLAHEFNENLPPVSELRRESLPVSMVTAPPPPSTRPRGTTPKRASASPIERPPRDRKARRRPERPPRKEPRQEITQDSASGKSSHFSSALAYWTGATIVGATLREGDLVFCADRRMGQNFAAIWSRKTKELIGMAPRLTMLDGGKVQEATLSARGLEAFIAKFGLASTVPSDDLGLPRWIWSNLEWKTACLQGLLDTVGRFQRNPSIILTLPQSLGRSAVKIFAALEFKAHTGRGDTVTFSGKEQIERYFKTFGTQNPKLKDQIQSYLNPRQPRSRQDTRSAEEPTEAIPETVSPEIPEPVTEDTAPPSAEPPTTPASEAPAPQKPRSGGRKRTVYRGRPKP